MSKIEESQEELLKKDLRIQATIIKALLVEHGHKYSVEDLEYFAKELEDILSDLGVESITDMQ